MAVKPNTVRLHQDIKKEFDKMSNIREYGVQKYSTDYILHAIAQKYYRAAKTVENIVFGRVNYPNQNQTELFTD
ncbi:hypothetical protein [Flavobacterium sp. UMI-01]|uniref:hypothetical protein n=1 Tax=Flavobacterium sp. UMI-01 TaxID=1441053 RepID=UPI001C7CC934|nr:hypothetical protein [Flavobacterium sp. UMI-01]GIZ09999.1 hypothetical protein FUMI01_27250 [Flavobacterium sp. UMI-01]